MTELIPPAISPEEVEQALFEKGKQTLFARFSLTDSDTLKMEQKPGLSVRNKPGIPFVLVSYNPTDGQAKKYFFVYGKDYKHLELGAIVQEKLKGEGIVPQAEILQQTMENIAKGKSPFSFMTGWCGVDEDMSEDGYTTEIATGEFSTHASSK